MSVPERMLWQESRQRPGGHKFRRQHPIGPYVAAFCCLQARLVVEVDGIVHNMGERAAADLTRGKYIKDKGFRVLRVSAARVMADAVGTAEAIARRCDGPLHQPAAGPPPRAGEGN